MEMQIKNHPRAGIMRRSIYALASWLCLAIFSPLHADDDYQYRVLFNPSEAMLEAERQGYVTIYDGLENSVVEEALTQQFDRIENMMFVGTRYVEEDGEVLFEEDGCD